MEKNLFLAVGLSVAVILLWTAVFNRPPRVPAPQAVQAQATSSTPALPVPDEKKPALPGNPEPAAEKELARVDNGRFSFGVTGRGGLSGFSLAGGDKLFLPAGGAFLSVPGGDFSIAGDSAVPGGRSIRLLDRQSGNLTEYTFYDGKDYFDVKWTPRGRTISLYLSNGLSLDSDTERDNIAANYFTYLAAGKLKREAKPGLYDITPEWFAVENKYYAAGFFPLNPVVVKTELSKSRNAFPEVKVSFPDSAGGFRVYAGKKSYPALKAFRPGFEKLVDFGYFREIGKVIYHLMNVFWKLTGNYGAAVILMTALVQLCMLPLTLKNLKSMKAMRDIQPLVNDLRIKYKSDPTRMNTEMMGLYKQKKVNPFGGCLPMLLQIPIFWALFTTLRNLVELKNAPFFWWIRDLSVPDRAFHLPFSLPLLGEFINILPLIMGGTMFLQQKMTPATGDAAQAKMMAIMMPVMFTFMFWSFPSGLVLYWMVSNVMSILTQTAYERKLIPGFGS